MEIMSKRTQRRRLAEEHKRPADGKHPATSSENNTTDQDTAVTTTVANLTKSNPITAKAGTDDTRNEKDPTQKMKVFWQFIIDPKHSSALMAIFTIFIFLTGAVYAAFAALQWAAMRTANKLTTDALKTSQRAYITIGRKDGVVAELVIPPNPKETAGIVIYFQNSGHLPALF